MIRIAEMAETANIVDLVKRTIEIVYPRYYPKGAVDFFLSHHSCENVKKDLENRLVYILEADGTTVGTVTIRENEIARLFVDPAYQKRGYGSELLSFAEDIIFCKYDAVKLDSSLPAQPIYLKKGYRAAAFYRIDTDNGDYLCYDEMEKRTENGKLN